MTMINARKSQPKSAKILADDASHRNQRLSWQAVTVFTILLFALYAFYSFNAIRAQASRTEVFVVKALPDGTTEMIDAGSKQRDFYARTIDAAFANFTEACYSRDPATFLDQAPICRNFLGPSLQMKYRDEMVEYADAIADGKAPRERIIARFREVLHTDRLPTRVDGQTDMTYESTIYATEYTRTATKDIEGDRLAIYVKWRFRSQEELNSTHQAFIARNPIGLEILERNAIADKFTGDNS